MKLIDRFNRVVNNVRISVTDRCNFRCTYCMPESGIKWMARKELLTYEEISRLVRVLAGQGVHKIRLTGGEPLMRHDVPVLVRMLSEVPGIDDIAMTTNGFFLAEQAVALKEAGLHRINVSLDSLHPDTFEKMTRRSSFDRVMEGITAAHSAGLRPIKLNAVLVRGVNDHEVGGFARLSREKGIIPRFIEFMPIGMDDGWEPGKVVSGSEVVDTIEREVGVRLVPQDRKGDQPADRYTFADGLGEIGFINSVSEPFCGSCNRIRITSDGKLRTCLFSLEETDLRALLRGGSDDAGIEREIRNAVIRKEEGHLINQPGFVRPERTMSQIGG